MNNQILSSNTIPYCNMNDVQMSFHGFRDAVKFFIALPGQTPSTLLHDDKLISESLTISSMTDTSASSFGDILVVSGGDGYNDFRIENTKKLDDNNDANNSIRHLSYLIVWHLSSA